MLKPAAELPKSQSFLLDLTLDFLQSHEASRAAATRKLYGQSRSNFGRPLTGIWAGTCVEAACRGDAR